MSDILQVNLLECLHQMTVAEYLIYVGSMLALSGMTMLVVRKSITMTATHPK